MVKARSLKTLGFLVGALLLGATPPPAEAGILDSIKNFFSGLLGGGGSGNKELEEAFTQVETSQKAVVEKQQELAPIYNGGKIDPKDATLQAKLGELSTVSRSNEQLYTQFLQLRGALKDKGTDLSKYQERLAKITDTQDKLEANYQKIQDANKASGFYAPPPETTSGSETLADTPGSKELPPDPWNHADVQGYIDEWLTKTSLNKWGQWEGRSKTAIVKAAMTPDPNGLPRHERVWRMLENDNAHSNFTLRAYVVARLHGESPVVIGPGGGGTIPPSETDGSASEIAAQAPAATAIAPTPTETAASTTSAATLTQIDSEIQSARTDLDRMLKEGQGNSAEARQLLLKIEELDRKLGELKAEAGSGN